MAKNVPNNSSEGVRSIRHPRTDFPQDGWISVAERADIPLRAAGRAQQLSSFRPLRTATGKRYQRDTNPDLGWITANVPAANAFDPATSSWATDSTTTRKRNPDQYYLFRSFQSSRFQEELVDAAWQQLVASFSVGKPKRDARYYQTVTDQGWITANVPVTVFDPASLAWPVASEAVPGRKQKRMARPPYPDTSWLNNVSEKPFPLTGLLDTFTRADESPVASSFGVAWQSSTTGRVVSQALQQTDAATSMSVYWTLPTSNDQEIFCTLPVVPDATDTFRLFVRFSGQNSGFESGYIWAITGSSWRLDVYLDGTLFQALASGTLVLSNGDSVGLSVYGTTIRVYHKPSTGEWTFLSKKTSASFSSGVVGLGNFGTVGTVRIDDLGGGPSLYPNACEVGSYRFRPALTDWKPKTLRDTNLDNAWLTVSQPVPFDPTLWPGISQLASDRTKQQHRIEMRLQQFFYDYAWVHDVIPLTDPDPAIATVIPRPIAPIMSARRRNRRRR